MCIQRYLLIVGTLLAIGSILFLADPAQMGKIFAAKVGAETPVNVLNSSNLSTNSPARSPYFRLSGMTPFEVSDRVQTLGRRIAKMKAQGLYDETLWGEYYDALYPSHPHFTRRLDQGGEDCVSAAVIASLPFTDSSSTVDANDDYDYSGGFSCPWASTSPDVVYQYLPMADELVDIKLCNSYYDTKLLVYEAFCNNDHIYDCDDDACGYFQGYTSQILDLNLYAGSTYYFVVDGYGGDEGSYRIEVDYAVPRPLNDDCVDAAEISCGATNVYVDLTDATLDCHNICSYPEVWYKFYLDSMVSDDWDVAVSYCGSDPSIGLIGTNLQNDCLCDDYINWSDTSSTHCTSPSWLSEWFYFNGIPAGWYYLPIYSDTGTYVLFDLTCTAAEPDSCPEAYCLGSPEVPNTGGCNEPPYESQMIESGEAICGTASADGGTRDTDWYMHISTDSVTFTWDVWSETPLNMAVAVLDHDCELLHFIDGSRCGEVTVTDCLPPGTYYFWTAHNDFYDVPEPTDYRAKLSTAPCNPWSCANPEQEPNDEFQPEQEISLGDIFCGVVSSPYDQDLVLLTMPSETAIRITVNGDGELHPCVEILTEYDEPLTLAGDTLNQATEFTSTTKLGEGTYILNVRGAAQTTGRYELWVDAVELDKVPPPEPVITLYSVGDQVEVRWYASYFPGEQIRLERSELLSGPWIELDVVPADQLSYSDEPPSGNFFYRAIAIGERDEDPFAGSIIAFSEMDDEGNETEIGEFVIHELEWAVDNDNTIIMSRFLAQGVPPNDDQWIDQDERNLYGTELTAIESFSGHKMVITGREVLIDHVAFAQDSLGGIHNIEGLGRDPKSDSIMAFSEFPMWLEPNTGTRQFSGFINNWQWPDEVWTWGCKKSMCCKIECTATRRVIRLWLRLDCTEIECEIHAWPCHCPTPRCPPVPVGRWRPMTGPYPMTGLQAACKTRCRGWLRAYLEITFCQTMCAQAKQSSA